MSVRVMTWVMYESPSTGNDRLILLVIADEADDDGRNAYPGVDLIAHKARVNRSTVLRSLARLEATGELLIKRPEHRGRGRHNRYVVAMGRDPIELAARLSWPAPKLNPETSQNDTYVSPAGDDPEPSPQPVENPGDDGAGDAKNGSERWHETPGKVAPGATRRVDARTQGSADVESPQPPRYRRGLDRPPEVVEAEKVATAQLAHIDRVQAASAASMAEGAGERLTGGELAGRARAARDALRAGPPDEPEAKTA